jgi:hypothetical protein
MNFKKYPMKFAIFPFLSANLIYVLRSIVLPYLTGNTLRLRYAPNRLMLSIGL